MDAVLTLGNSYNFSVSLWCLRRKEEFERRELKVGLVVAVCEEPTMVLDADLTTPRCLRTRLSQSKAVAQRVCRTAPSSPQPFYLFLFYFARNARANLALDWGRGGRGEWGGTFPFGPSGEFIRGLAWKWVAGSEAW